MRLSARYAVMQDYLFFLRAHPNAAHTYQQWWLNDMGPRLAAAHGCVHLKVNIAVDPPGKLMLYKNEAREGGHFDVTLDLTCADRAAYTRLAGAFGLEFASRSEANFVYEVTRNVELDDAEKLKGNPAPGYKIMRGFYVYDDLSDSAYRRSWDIHAKLAKRAHGFTRYTRYFVGKPMTEGAPQIRGATALHFASAEDVLERYFLIPNGSEAIAHDISHFIESGLARVYTKEHTLK
jgi:hypothetical protein